MALSKVIHDALSFPFQGYIFGLNMSTVGASTTLTVGAGAACDSTGQRIMRFPLSFAKTTAAWNAGSTVGGLDTGSIAASTWYHWFLIMNVTSGQVDIVFSATSTPQNGPTTMPSGYTLFRRIGSMQTNASSQWTAFIQYGDFFQWSVPPALDLSTATLSTTPVAFTVTVPPNIGSVEVVGSSFMQNSSAQTIGLIWNADLANQAVSISAAPLTNIQIGAAGSTLVQSGQQTRLMTSTARQLKVVANAASTSFAWCTTGYVDTRGRLQ